MKKHRINTPSMHALRGPLGPNSRRATQPELPKEMRSMSMGTRARQALHRAAKWERNRFGISAIMPDCVQRPLRRMISKRLLTEGRRFLPAYRAVDFFQNLQRNGTSYVVIRWFESLPDRVDGDIDFLVADDGLVDFEALLDRTPSGIPCDIYAATGVPGFSYGSIPYYPPDLARRILERRVITGKGVSAPCPQDHFLSLAYHCVYQKGMASGLPTTYRRLRPVSVPRHDYRGTLAALAATLGLPVPINMEALDQFLAEEGWRPPSPVLEQLAADNLWIHCHFGTAGRYRSTAKTHTDIGAP